ncbi:MAG: P-II family nitrogen regulator [Alphaproteobacteria bacterium]
MQLVIAVIRPTRLDEVRAGLASLGVGGMTVSEVLGFGRQKGQADIYRGAEYEVAFVPKVKIEVVIDDDLLERVVECVQKAAWTGKTGDGKIFTIDVGSATRIRTGDVDLNAL